MCALGHSQYVLLLSAYTLHVIAVHVSSSIRMAFTCAAPTKVMRWADIKSLEIRDIQDIGQCLEILAANESAIVYDWQVDLSLTRIRQALVCRMEEVGENVIR